MNVIQNMKVQDELLPGMSAELVKANSEGDVVHALEVIQGIKAIRQLYPVPAWEIA